MYIDKCVRKVCSVYYHWYVVHLNQVLFLVLPLGLVLLLPKLMKNIDPEQQKVRGTSHYIHTVIMEYSMTVA